MSLANVSLNDLFLNISNAFVSTVADLGSDPAQQKSDNVDAVTGQLYTENRYMYLALLLLLIMVLANILFA